MKERGCLRGDHLGRGKNIKSWKGVVELSRGKCTYFNYVREGLVSLKGTNTGGERRYEEGSGTEWLYLLKEGRHAYPISCSQGLLQVSCFVRGKPAGKKVWHLYGLKCLDHGGFGVDLEEGPAKSKGFPESGIRSH